MKLYLEERIRKIGMGKLRPVSILDQKGKRVMSTPLTPVMSTPFIERTPVCPEDGRRVRSRER